ncbi:hypothetical protein [Novosphingobium sp.]|uniref:hypothetical protein n=1 Tax=Novosphingobium sp. TaxID=1874826 RepID=UPI0031DC13BB
MQDGKVVEVWANGSMLKVHSGSTVSVVELLGDEGAIEVGDTLKGNWTALGGETIWRGSECFDAFIQDYG